MFLVMDAPVAVRPTIKAIKAIEARSEKSSGRQTRRRKTKRNRRKQTNRQDQQSACYSGEDRRTASGVLRSVAVTAAHITQMYLQQYYSTRNTHIYVRDEDVRFCSSLARSLCAAPAIYWLCRISSCCCISSIV